MSRRRRPAQPSLKSTRSGVGGGPHVAKRAERGEGPPRVNLERETGFEPATSTLARSHSTTELFPLARTLTVPHGRGRVQPTSAFLRAGGAGAGAASAGWAPATAPACSAIFKVWIRSRWRSLRFLLTWNRERSPLRLDIIKPFVKKSQSRKNATCDGVTFDAERPKPPHAGPSG